MTESMQSEAMQGHPFFSVVIPTYNRAHLIKKTIDSILGQTFGDFELLIVDDGSNDKTEETVKSYSDPRISYFKKENGERGAARNYGSQKARGQYLNFVDSDDLLYPHHLKSAFDFIKEWDFPEWIHMGFDWRDEEGNVIGSCTLSGEDIRSSIIFDNKLSCDAVFQRRDIVMAFPFEENRALASSEDWELWLRLASRYPLRSSHLITSSVVMHDARSLITIDPERIVTRDLLMIELLNKDEAVRRYYGKRFRKFVAERYSFFMLKFAERNSKSGVLKWAWLAALAYPPVIFSRRYIASIKNLLI